VTPKENLNALYIMKQQVYLTY